VTSTAALTLASARTGHEDLGSGTLAFNGERSSRQRARHASFGDVPILRITVLSSSKIIGSVAARPNLHMQIVDDAYLLVSPACGDWRDSGGPERRARRDRVCPFPAARRDRFALDVVAASLGQRRRRHRRCASALVLAAEADPG
jgi:hypothetical protein